MSIPSIISELVEKFELHKDSYTSGTYNEAQLRIEFIDPFFEALGWDINNKQGYAENYKEVIHEDAIKVGGVTKAPDYCFRIGGVRKFFLEAKKPSVDIKEAIHPAYQLRRYAWSAKLPLSILTDFEEFAIYDCRIKPDLSDKPSQARTLYLQYSDYIDKWNDIANIFSKDAILKGSFDKYVETTKIKKGTAEVDDAFLKEIESWRDILARNIAIRNPQLSQRELNFAVQQSIDRIIFLRICEDRGIENYGRLQALLNGTQIYNRLGELFRMADERYNSGLFYFRKESGRFGSPDELTLNLTIDDNTLKEIIKNLYYPDSPYEFSVLPAYILGYVYEQFLGKVIRLTAGHRAVVEEKPEVRKAGGVYYTPTYIVDYIVKNTVGKLVENKSPNEVEKLRILDPACGSGSFLLGAYQYLLDWHQNWYTKNNPEKWLKGRNPRLVEHRKGDFRLTTPERKRILLNNIYGVDIDPQAVEVTKLSLLLKVLEGETEETIVNQLKLFHERALPDLANNIKCGNSLIGPDFYENQQMDLFNEEERYRINAFDWNTEFSEIMKDGGFDAVIGNPPWGAEFSEDELEYHRTNNSEIIVRMIDSFMYFVYQFTKKLRKSGHFGMILPDVILYQIDNEKLRRYLLDKYVLKLIINMGDVFEKVTRPASIIIVKNDIEKKSIIQILNIASFKKYEKSNLLSEDSKYEFMEQSAIKRIPGYLFITINPKNYTILEKIYEIPHNCLLDLVDEDGIQRGVSPDLKEAFIVDDKIAKKFLLEKIYLRKVLTGGIHVKRYRTDYPDLWLIYTTKKEDFKKLPNICKYIDQFTKEITCKEVKQNKHSKYSLHRARDEKIFLKPQKIIGVITEDEIVVALDSRQTFVTDGIYLFGIKEGIDINYILGILNSKLFVFLYRLLALEQERVLAQVKPTILNKLPIRKIDLNNRDEKSKHDRLVSYAERIIKCYEQLKYSKTEHDKTIISRQIEATDRQIDKLVYELYGLTEEEISIIEKDNII